MNFTLTCRSPSRRSRRCGARRERGLAMFIVLMIIVMVSAAGVFVARSSSLEILSAGFVRQAGQAHNIAEAGTSTVLSRMRMACVTYFTPYLRQQAITGAIPVTQCPPVLTSRGPVTPACYVFLMSDFNTLFGVALPVFVSPAGAGPTRTEGSFGMGQLTPDFRVAVTEISADVTPQAGSDLGNPSLAILPVRFEISASGYADTMPLATAAVATDLNVRGTEAIRAITAVPCS